MFERRIEPGCGYCRYGADIGNFEVACVKRGIMAAYGYCAAFVYEPTKRQPDRMERLHISGFSGEEFSLEE